MLRRTDSTRYDIENKNVQPNASQPTEDHFPDTRQMAHDIACKIIDPRAQRIIDQYFSDFTVEQMPSVMMVNCSCGKVHRLVHKNNGSFFRCNGDWVRETRFMNFTRKSW